MIDNKMLISNYNLVLFHSNRKKVGFINVGFMISWSNVKFITTGNRILSLRIVNFSK